MKGDQYQVMVRDSLPLALEKFENGEYYLADPKTDLALLKIKDDDRAQIRPIAFGDSNKLSEGEWVLAIGNPYGLRQTITSGIVSSKGRDNIGFADIEDFIQTDVPINPGNSGGPLINLDGRLVGINTAITVRVGRVPGHQLCHTVEPCPAGLPGAHRSRQGPARVDRLSRKGKADRAR